MVAKAANKDKAVAPSLLSCERKINVSDAVFQAGTWNFKSSISQEGQSADGFTPIPVVEKSVRGTVSNRVTARSRLNVEPNVTSDVIFSMQRETHTDTQS